jgi:hypothetical protein
MKEGAVVESLDEDGPLCEMGGRIVEQMGGEIEQTGAQALSLRLEGESDNRMKPVARRVDPAHDLFRGEGRIGNGHE